MIISHRPAFALTSYGAAGPHRRTQTDTDTTSPLTEHTGSQSYIELRSNRISLKALPMGGRKRPAQWGVHDRKTSAPKAGKSFRGG